MFKVGDLIMCNVRNTYVSTSTDVLCVVVKINRGSRNDIAVKILKSDNPHVDKSEIGATYNVQSKHFSLIE